MDNPRTFAIWGNTDKPKFWKTLPGILDWAKNNDLNPYITTRINKQFKEKGYPVIKKSDDFNKMDFVLTIGGDGTILSAARAIKHRKIPILGIHLGDLGFMAKVTLAELYTRLDQVKTGDFDVSKHRVLETEVIHNGDSTKSFALNDIVVNNGTSHRMVTCLVVADR